MATNTELGNKRQVGFFRAPVLAGVAVLIVAVLVMAGYLLLQQPSSPAGGGPRQSNGSTEVLEGNAIVAPSITPTPRPTNTPLPFPTLRPTDTEVPVDTPIPTNTPLPTDTALPSAMPTLTTTAAPPPSVATRSTAPSTPASGNQSSGSSPTLKPLPPSSSNGGSTAGVVGLPQMLRIPAIGVNAAVEKVGINSDGTMGVPVNEWNVGWYKLGYRPGSNGNAVIAGHLDWTNGPAVFWNLKKLNPGDEIFVKDDKGVERKFVVNQLVVYPYNNAPLDTIFGGANQGKLNLITCAGTYDKKLRNYNKRLVVYTTLAGNAGN